jgi:hypothetical protein
VLLPKQLNTKVAGSFRSVYAIKALTISALVPAVIHGLQSEVVNTSCMKDLLAIVEHLCVIEFGGHLISHRSVRKHSGGEVFSQAFAQNGGLDALVAVLKTASLSTETVLDPLVVAMLLSTIDRIRQASKRGTQLSVSKPSREAVACRSRAVKVLGRSLLATEPEACLQALVAILEVLNQSPLEALRGARPSLSAKTPLATIWWARTNLNWRLCMVRVFRQKFSLEAAIELHACAPLEARPCV